MVERSLSMREVPGSMPGSSSLLKLFESYSAQSTKYRMYCMSGWPSGLRRQTQETVSSFDLKGAFWSTNVGVGSNPTSDNVFSFIQSVFKI